MNDPARQERIEAAKHAWGKYYRPTTLGRLEIVLEAADAVPPRPRYDEGDPVYLTAQERTAVLSTMGPEPQTWRLAPEWRAAHAKLQAAQESRS